MSTDDEIERLAARGRAQRARIEAARREEAASASLEERDARERRLRAALSVYARWGWILAGLAGGVPSGVLVGRMLPASAWEGESPGGIAVLLVVLLGLVLAWLTRGRVGQGAVEREYEWLASLPFPVEGYPGVLTQRDGFEGRIEVLPTFAEDAPDDELLQDLMQAVSAQRREGSRYFGTSFDFGESSATDNAHLAKWAHAVLRALLALHARHPLRSVEFRLD